MFPTNQVGNFILARETRVWESSDMSDAKELKGKDLYDAFMVLKPDKLAETDWAVKAGVNRGFFTNLKAQPISPRAANVRKLLAAVNRTEADLYAAARGERPRQWADHPATRSTDAGETGQVIRLDLSLPMGQGATVDDYIEEEPVTFDLGYVRSFTRTPLGRLRLARGVGDSMMPTLLPGDEVWIDSTQTRLNQSDKVWAVSINGGAAIKRLRPLRGNKVLVISDNKTIGDYEVDADEILIGGRVVRFERDL